MYCGAGGTITNFDSEKRDCAEKAEIELLDSDEGVSFFSFYYFNIIEVYIIYFIVQGGPLMRSLF